MSSAEGAQNLIGPIRTALAGVDESQRYRVLATLFGELAKQSQAGDNGRRAGQAQVESLAKKIQSLHEDNAAVNDKLAATRADLERRQSQFEAEQIRADELKRIVDEQRGRLELLKKQLADAEAAIQAREADVHKLQRQNETLELSLQRAESASDQSGRIDSLESSKAEFAAEVQRLQCDLDQVRADRDAEIERLKTEAKQAAAGAGSPEGILVPVWKRLAAAKPPLVESLDAPDAKAAEHLADSVIELVSAAQGFEKTMSVFLGKYTKPNPSIKVPWDVYMKQDLLKTAQQVLAPKGGKAVGLLKLRLRFLYRWTEASMIACDSVIESTASELQSHLMGELGAGADPNRKIRDYVRNDGHHLFLQHLREMLSNKLAEVFGRGG